MTKEFFLQDPSVQNFVKWVIPKLSSEFQREYTFSKPKGKRFVCNSIFNAYENYYWPFKYMNPSNGEIEKGATFQESAFHLKELSNQLRIALSSSNKQDVLAYAKAVLQWGGGDRIVRPNYAKLVNKGDGIIQYLNDCVRYLNPNMVDLNNSNLSSIMMSAGLTKIYSLLIDDFIIYDGRVGAALGLLVKQYCKDQHILSIPQNLLFAYGNDSRAHIKGVQNRRNPSDEQYKFPLLKKDFFHTQQNIKANWLLKHILDSDQTSPFKQLDLDMQLRALEAAFFMVGYHL